MIASDRNGPSDPDLDHRNADLPGSIGPYPVTGILGRGGTGVVYAGRDPKLQRPIAIKVLLPESPIDSAGLARLEHEARLLAGLNHPNIATVYSLERCGDIDFLTMEFLSGFTLAERVARSRIPPLQCLEFARQIVGALEAAHLAGVVHLDLKPTNIIVTADERVKLLDFGLARVFGANAGETGGTESDDPTLEIGIQGTPGYMSPEQLRGGPFDARSDIWAFGCVLFEMLAGNPAFPGETMPDRIAATLRSRPDWRSLPPDTPERVRTLIEQCLEPEVHRRLESMTPARRILDAAIAGGHAALWVSSLPPRGGENPTNLPSHLTSFVGREKPLDDLELLLSSERLVTVTGPGGCGKTRIAREVGHRLLPRFPDGVWIVELAPLSEPEMVPHAVCSALGIREDSGRALTETLRLGLKTKRLLMLLDNCEHLLDASARLAQFLLQECPKLSILATSRERLAVEGESICPLPSLAVPELMGLPVESMERIESVRLFGDRARAVDPRFALTSTNADQVAQICRRLDGMPLALELAAARVGVLPLDEIVRRLDDRFHLLTTSSPTSISRHRTLRAMIDWSHDHLPEMEQVLFRRLGVFVGGWSLEAVEEICAPGDIEPWRILDLHSRLVERSLVERDLDAARRTGQVRYRALETILDYAREKLRESPDEMEMQLRHRAYFMAMAVGSSAHLVGPEQREWSQRLEVDHDNLRSAIAGACAPGPERDVDAALRIVASLGRYWYGRGRWTEGRTLMKEVLRLDGSAARTLDRAQALAWTGWIALWQGDLEEAWVLNHESLEIRRERGDRMGIAQSLNNLGAVALERGDFQASRTYYEESLDLRRAEGNLRYQAVSLHNLGELCFRMGEFGEARRFDEESLALRREVGDLMGIADSLNALGLVAERMGDLEDARAYYEASLVNRIAREDRMGIGESLHNLASIDARERHLDRARLRYAKCLSIRRELGDRLGITEALESYGLLELEAGDFRSAVRFLAAASAVRAEIEATAPPSRVPQLTEAVDRLRGALGESVFRDEWSRGAALRLDQLVDLPPSGSAHADPA